MLRQLLEKTPLEDRRSAARLIATALVSQDPEILADALAASEFSDGELVYLGTLPGRVQPVTNHSRPSGDERRPTRRADTEAYVLERIASSLGETPRRAARGKTYRLRNGKELHVRTMVPHPRGPGESSCFYGLAADKWNDEEFFVLAFGAEGILVVPVPDWRPYQSQMPTSTDPSSGQLVFKPTLWRTNGGSIELRVGGQHIDASQWLDQWDALR